MKLSLHLPAPKFHVLSKNSQEPGLYLWMLTRALPAFLFVIVIIFTGYTYSSKTVVEQSASRNAQLQVQVLRHEIEQKLQETRNQLLFLSAATRIIKEDMIRRFSYRTHFERNSFRELAFIGKNPENCFVLLNLDGKVQALPRNVFNNAVNGPFSKLPDELHGQGEVDISPPVQVNYSMIPDGDTVQNVSLSVLRFYTLIYNEKNEFEGILLLSLDLNVLRDALALFSSSSSSLYDQQSDFKHMRSIFVDSNGWMLFQSESPDAERAPLSTDAIRSGCRGDYGRPDFRIAFRPSHDQDKYWNMIADIKEGKSGQIDLGGLPSWGDSQWPAKFLSYAPISYSNGTNPKIIIGGVATLDTDYITTQDTSLLFASLFTCIILAAAAITLYSLLWAKQITKHLARISRHLHTQHTEDGVAPLPACPMPYEFATLQDEINTLFERLSTASADSRAFRIQKESRSQREIVPDMPRPDTLEDKAIIGASPVMKDLDSQIDRAAATDADILVFGETGTGKELVSEAIHSRSSRADKPFISINCGALDENLLIDTLFGHMRGAFSDARSDRKGAFLAAEGGTLMLDEIGNASPRVQQALLRALSTRTIHPLGSDKDIPFDVRIVAATNVNLLNEADQGRFRKDLYYRLAVIAIQTPPLRARKEDIPLLVSYFLGRAAKEQNKAPARISRGALQKLTANDWPGNIRQLENTLTRALVFSDQNVIQTENIQFTQNAPPRALPRTDSAAAHDARSGQNDTRSGQEQNPVPGEDLYSNLNERQKKLMPLLRKQGTITRREYQNIMGNGFSRRTAQYELQKLVQLGVLCKKGFGPALHYELVVQVKKPSADTARNAHGHTA